MRTFILRSPSYYKLAKTFRNFGSHPGNEIKYSRSGLYYTTVNVDKDYIAEFLSKVEKGVTHHLSFNFSLELIKEALLSRQQAKQ